MPLYLMISTLWPWEFWVCPGKYRNSINFRHGLIFVNFGHTKKYRNLFCACNAIRNCIAQAGMTKLNPARNYKFWRNPEMSGIKATENYYNYGKLSMSGCTVKPACVQRPPPVHSMHDVPEVWGGEAYTFFEIWRGVVPLGSFAYLWN